MVTGDWWQGTLENVHTGEQIAYGTTLTNLATWLYPHGDWQVIGEPVPVASIAQLAVNTGLDTEVLQEIAQDPSAVPLVQDDAGQLYVAEEIPITVIGTPYGPDDTAVAVAPVEGPSILLLGGLAWLGRKLLGF